MKTLFVIVFLSISYNVQLVAQSASKLIKQADKELAAANFQQAIKTASSALTMDATKTEANVIRAKAYNKLGMTTEALADFETAAKAQPKNFTLFYEILIKNFFFLVITQFIFFSKLYISKKISFQK